MEEAAIGEGSEGRSGEGRSSERKAETGEAAGYPRRSTRI
jgi:hypothetical protein